MHILLVYNPDVILVLPFLILAVDCEYILLSLQRIVNGSMVNLETVVSLAEVELSTGTQSS